jgi:osmotically-inducible protein OsmY
MINGNVDLVDATYSMPGLNPSVFSARGGPDLLTEYMRSLSALTPSWQPELATPGMSSVYNQIQQSLQTMHQQAQQQLHQLHQQIQLQIAQNPYTAQLQVQYFHQQAQQLLQATLWQAQQHLQTLLRTSTQRQFQGQPRAREYQLSDEEIVANLSQVLEFNPVTVSADIEVDAKNHEVTLRGVAPNRLVKRAADMVAWDIPGVKDVHNTIEIESRRTKRGTRGQVNRETIRTDR